MEVYIDSRYRNNKWYACVKLWGFCGNQMHTFFWFGNWWYAEYDALVVHKCRWICIYVCWKLMRIFRNFNVDMRVVWLSHIMRGLCCWWICVYVHINICIYIYVYIRWKLIWIMRNFEIEMEGGVPEPNYLRPSWWIYICVYIWRYVYIYIYIYIYDGN